MKHLLLAFLNIVLFFQYSFSQKPINYPATAHSNATDTFFGTIIHDPFRWMEKPSDSSLKVWLKQQEKLSNKFSRKITFGDNIMMYRYIQLFSRRYSSYLIKRRSLYFSYLVNRYDNLPYLVQHKNEEDKEGRVIFNVSDLRNYGQEEVHIDELNVSNDEKYLAMTISRSGSDKTETRIFDLKKRQLLPEVLRNLVYTHIEWDSDGILYISHKIKDSGLYHHTLGQRQNEDKPYYIPKEEKRGLHFSVTPSNGLIVLYENLIKDSVLYQTISYIPKRTRQDTVINEPNLFFATRTTADLSLTILDDFEDSFIVITNLKSPNKRILKCNMSSLNGMSVLIPEYREVLNSVTLCDQKILCVYQKSTKYFSVLFDRHGNILDLYHFPTGTSVSGFDAMPDDTEVIYYQNSFYYPDLVLKYNVRSFINKPALKTYITFDYDNFLTEVVEYPSKDGTKIPMYITRHKDTKLDGINPTILYGYGGFARSAEPFFDPAMIVFFHNSGILAFPAIRGGGDFGELWHEQGVNLNKQKSFDDFIAAAEYLVKNNYTNSQKLAIMGGSNGGLLVASVMLQRPELFKVAVAEAGVYDMFRYPIFTAGKFWLDEYGSIMDSAEFKNLLSYSPLHNVKEGVNYPSTLLLTGAKDDRVVPMHSYKFLVTLQEKGGKKNPYLLYVEPESGHSGSVIGDSRALESAFKFCFILSEMGIVPNFNFIY